MTQDQFKAWFEGFAEALPGPPSAEQWEKVRQKVASMGSSFGQPINVPTVSIPNTNHVPGDWPLIVTSSVVGAKDSFPHSLSETVAWPWETIQ